MCYFNVSCLFSRESHSSFLSPRHPNIALFITVLMKLNNRRSPDLFSRRVVEVVMKKLRGHRLTGADIAGSGSFLDDVS